MNDRNHYRPPVDPRADNSTPPRDPVDESSEEDRELLNDETEGTQDQELDPMPDATHVEDKTEADSEPTDEIHGEQESSEEDRSSEVDSGHSA